MLNLRIATAALGVALIAAPAALAQDKAIVVASTTSTCDTARGVSAPAAPRGPAATGTA